MNSVDFTVFELFDTDLFEAASEESDLDDGDFGIGLGLAVVPISVARDFFVGELLLNVNDLLDGRSRLVPSELLGAWVFLCPQTPRSREWMLWRVVVYRACVYGQNLL
jgi:hypothetical protein